MDEIKAALSEKLGSKVAFEIPLFGGIPVPQSALVTWVIIALLTVFAIWLTHGLQKKPGRRQMVAELMVGSSTTSVRELWGKSTGELSLLT